MIVKTLKFDGNWRFIQYQTTDTIAPNNLAPGGIDGDVLVKDSLLPDGKKWAAPPATGVAGSAIAGQVTFWIGPTTIAGKALFVWNNATDRLGIGIDPPTAKVHIKGEGDTRTTFALKIDNSIGEPSLYVRDSGHVTIGTADDTDPIYGVGLSHFRVRGLSGDLSVSQNQCMSLTNEGISVIQLVGYPTIDGGGLITAWVGTETGHDWGVYIAGGTERIRVKGGGAGSAAKIGMSTGGTTISTLLQLGRAADPATFGLVAGNGLMTTIRPSATTAAWTLTLPVDDGTPSQVLTTDGFGVTSWTTPSPGFLNPMTTFGDMIYEDNGSPPAAARLPGNTTTAQLWLSQTGDGVNSGIPVWSPLISGATVGDLLYAASATTIGKLPDQVVGMALASGGVGAAPFYTTDLLLGNILLSPPEEGRLRLMGPNGYVIGLNANTVGTADYDLYFPDWDTVASNYIPYIVNFFPAPNKAILRFSKATALIDFASVDQINIGYDADPLVVGPSPLERSVFGNAVNMYNWQNY